MTDTAVETKDAAALAVDTIKVLAMDAVQRADSGHPGMPMGMAEIATVLWTEFLTVDPNRPLWPNRDRFVVSNGHGSMLLYALLHLSGFGISMDDIRNFRQFGSPTPGHPEWEPHLGIETTTGPLGQGFGNGIGMAIAEAHLRAVFGSDLVDHRTFAFVSDGDLMEGVASEAASIAGHLALGKVVYFYDDNEISIEGDTGITFDEDVEQRFTAYGWRTVVVDGHDRAAIREATREAVGQQERPTLITCKTHIAHGAPTMQDTAEAHGSPLGDDEIARAKQRMGWDAPPFTVPDPVHDLFSSAMERGTATADAWEERRDAAFDDDPDLAGRWAAFWDPEPLTVDRLSFDIGAKVATRAASGAVIGQLEERAPNLIGGSADLAPSTKTRFPGSTLFSRDDRSGRNFAFGVREHAMGAIVNGMNLHGGVRAFGSTFLTFSDYMRPSVRLAALMGLPSIWVWTHDSIFLGEDGPTHQPVEHLSSLRAMPGMWTIRPADAGETAEAWEMALARTDGPSALVLTRQGVPVLDRTGRNGEVRRGGYVLRDGDDAVLVATGSEVWVALEAADLLSGDGISLRVVSMPCVEVFLAQDAAYRVEVVPPDLPVATLEAGSTWGWERIAGRDGLLMGVDHFGESAPWEDIAEEWGFTGEAVAGRVSAWLGDR